MSTRDGSKKRLSPAARQAIRSTKTRKTLGLDARCSRCGYADPTALQPVLHCYECVASEQGRAPVEDHHILGQSNDPSTIGVPGNPHRSLSNRMQDWEDELLRGDPADPLLWIVRFLRAMKDGAEWLVDRADQLVHYLLRFRQWLIEHHGTMWWTKVGLGPLWGPA